MNPLRDAARILYELRQREGWPALEEAFSSCTDEEIDAVTRCWQFIAHDYQIRPADVALWFIMAGRGSGKTRAGAEDTLDISEDWGPDYKGLLCNKTSADVRDVQIYGSSGLVACARRRGYTVTYVANRRRVYFPGGGEALVISSDAEEAIRGPEFNHLWADEIAKWHNPIKVWQEQIDLALRVKAPDGGPPRATITSTPKRASPIIRFLLKSIPGIHVTTAHTDDNLENLSADAVKRMKATLEGTNLGRQELGGEFIDTIGATVSQEIIHEFRVRRPPDLGRVVISFDPAIEDDEDADDHGIIAIGEDRKSPADAYVLDDWTLSQADPDTAARAVVKCALKWNASEILVEKNQGGKWITSHLRIAMETLSKELSETNGRTMRIAIPIVGVWAKQAKEVRAEPVGALYEKGRVHHVQVHPELERELTKWVPGARSPNRLDALVHGVTHFLLGDESEIGPLGSYLL